MSRESIAALKLSSLREALGMNQEAFAKELEIGQSVVSAWERGEYAPSAESYVNLVRLAVKHDRFPDALWFLEQAGIPAGVHGALSAFVKESRAGGIATYRKAFIEAEKDYPGDEIAQGRKADRERARFLRKRGSKK